MEVTKAKAVLIASKLDKIFAVPRGTVSSVLVQEVLEYKSTSNEEAYFGYGIYNEEQELLPQGTLVTNSLRGYLWDYISKEELMGL
jgi:hypothetical protein